MADDDDRRIKEFAEMVLRLDGGGPLGVRHPLHAELKMAANLFHSLKARADDQAGVIAALDARTLRLARRIEELQAKIDDA